MENYLLLYYPFQDYARSYGFLVYRELCFSDLVKDRVQSYNSYCWMDAWGGLLIFLKEKRISFRVLQAIKREIDIQRGPVKVASG